ncbi:MAG: YncE family protein, partial [Paludibacteraceae bacterium]
HLGQLWVNSRGDYYDTPSRLYCLTASLVNGQEGGERTDIPLDSIDIPVSNFTILGDSLYFCGTQFSYITYEDEITYGVIDIRTYQLLTTRLITDSITLVKPYGIAVHPTTREIYITDAGNYVTPGMLYCFSPQGDFQWSVRTGDIPSAICFLWNHEQGTKSQD